MFEYKKRSLSKNFKINLKSLLPSIQAQSGKFTRSITLVYEFLVAREITKLSMVSKQWYLASQDHFLWKRQCQYLAPQVLINTLEVASNLKITKEWPEEARRPKFAETVKWKLVWIEITYKCCHECYNLLNKLHYLPMLQFTLCKSCAKSPKYSMMSEESAELDYRISSEEIKRAGLPFIEVPHSHWTGKVAKMYYAIDLIKLAKINKEMPLIKRENCEEVRRTEILYYLKEKGCRDFDFIEYGLEVEGGWPWNYIKGKSQRTAQKVVSDMLGQYSHWLKKIEKEGQPKKRVKTAAQEVIDLD
ncbi:unnamed protein product [Blepharisma stoltei]|uniref:F-box domain-containing protein n=1 Tax=Blepharisma stoltei TaxID=1481888 RepID=A0AAU9JIJ9_9CILI|nr:unnamed protein product [Blepharisma stoltei]